MLNYKKFAMIVIISVLLITTIPIAGESIQNSKYIVSDNIKIMIDGQEFIPKDVTGNIVEPFLYNGTTYVPIRAISEVYNKVVSWDGENSIVYITNKPYFFGPYPSDGRKLDDKSKIKLDNYVFTNEIYLQLKENAQLETVLDSIKEKYQCESISVMNYVELNDTFRIKFPMMVTKEIVQEILYSDSVTYAVPVTVKGGYED